MLIYSNQSSSTKKKFCDHLFRLKFAQGTGKPSVVCVRCNWSLGVRL